MILYKIKCMPNLLCYVFYMNLSIPIDYFLYNFPRCMHVIIFPIIVKWISSLGVIIVLNLNEGICHTYMCLWCDSKFLGYLV
jgi:hypothetical protein